jgi:aminomethyltransferase
MLFRRRIKKLRRPLQKMALRELPLKTLWQSLGASFKIEGDWETVSLFKDDLEEYRAVREAVGLIDDSARGKIRVTGKDRTAWLHNILTNDIKSLRVGDGCYAALLSATGKVLADMNVYIFAHSILLEMEIGLEKKLAELMNKYMIQEDVKLEDVTEHYALLSLQGPRSEPLAQALFPGPFPELFDRQHADFHKEEFEVTLICNSRTGEKGYQLLIPRDGARKLTDRALTIGKQYGLKPVGSRASEILRMEAGILRYGVDMDETMTLPETGLVEVTASETKGCYPGQEVVARTMTYGGLNRKITGLIFEKEFLPQEGDRIYGDEKEIGCITSACISPRLGKGIAIGMVAKGFFETPREVKIKAREGMIPALTSALPFVKTRRA